MPFRIVFQLLIFRSLFPKPYNTVHGSDGYIAVEWDTVWCLSVQEKGIKLFRLVHVELYKPMKDFCLFPAYRYQFWC